MRKLKFLGLTLLRNILIWWFRFKGYLQKLYTTLYLNEITYFCLFLLHRYSPKQIDFRNVPQNLRMIFRGNWLTSSQRGKLSLLTTKREKFFFSLWNILLFGALQKRIERVIYFSFITITLELNNPFDTKILMFFLEKKLSILNRFLTYLELINGKRWDQKRIKLHIDSFYRNSLLQHQIIRNMQKALHRQKMPKIILKAQKGLEKGFGPILVVEGYSGSYWIRGPEREVLGLFKPFDEEIQGPNNPIGPEFQGALGQRQIRTGCRVGESAHHEVGAFLVDAFFGFGIVPRTYYAKFSHRTFFLAGEDRFASLRSKKTKYGSFQEFIEGFTSLSKIYKEQKDLLPSIEFQLLVVLDVIIGNTDRNLGNILVGEEKIAAIDHGLCFPDDHYNLSYWYWEFEPGKKPLISSLVDLLDNFPFEALQWKLKKNCYITQNCLDRMHERVVLFREGIRRGLMPSEMIDLMLPDYLYPIRDYKETLTIKAREQVERYLKVIQILKNKVTN